MEIVCFKRSSFKHYRNEQKIMEVRGTMRKKILLGQIKLKQKDMYMKAKVLGFTHPSVVSCSQELDNLLNRYQGLKAM